MKKRALILLAVIVAVAAMSAGCGNSNTNNTAADVTDYSVSAHWLSLPASPDKAVDVFFLYPSAYQKANADDPGICAIDNPSTVQGANLAFGRDATVFEPIANIYAPYYRQSDMSVLSLPQDQQAQVIGGIPTTDANAAFDYYIKHYNNGRPFILAGITMPMRAWTKPRAWLFAAPPMRRPWLPETRYSPRVFTIPSIIRFITSISGPMPPKESTTS